MDCSETLSDTIEFAQEGADKLMLSVQLLLSSTELTLKYELKYDHCVKSSYI